MALSPNDYSFGMSSHVSFVSISALIENPNGSEWWSGNELFETNEYIWSRLGVVTLEVVAEQRIRRDHENTQFSYRLWEQSIMKTTGARYID